MEISEKQRYTKKQNNLPKKPGVFLSLSDQSESRAWSSSLDDFNSIFYKFKCSFCFRKLPLLILLVSTEEFEVCPV